MADDAVAVRLHERIASLLADGRIDAAVEAAQSALRSSPDDRAVRREFIDLHLSLARVWLAEERFADAATALDAVLRVDPAQGDARRLRDSIESARRAVPQRVRQARDWLDIEWFEPAFNAFRQAAALSPENAPERIAAYRAAAVGAGDDEYLTKNFHRAFYFYDAALQLASGDREPVAPSLVSRWLQSMVHALADDTERLRYPAAYWKIVFERVTSLNYDGPGAATLMSTIEAMAFEHAGDTERAARAYARVGGGLQSERSLDAARAAAIGEIRKLYDPSLTDRRRGDWARTDGGAWELLETPRFRIHHRNRFAAARVAKALAFHFDRLADLWALDVGEIPWPVVADVHLYPDQAAFASATNQSPPVTAVSHVRLRGSHVESMAIHAHLEDRLLLSASLGHELAHLMIANVRGDRTLPPVIAEGLALHAEPQCRHRQFARLFESNRQPHSVARLLKFEQSHPTDANFYSEAHRLMAVLRTRTDISEIAAMSIDDVDAAGLAKRCGFGDRRQLERLYRTIAPEDRAPSP